MNAAIIVALLVGLAAPLASYLVVARKLSGKIGHSDASELWTESRAIREDYARRIELQDSRIKYCQDQIDKLVKEKELLEKTIDAHEGTIKILTRQVDTLTANEIELKKENHNLKEANIRLSSRVTELESGKNT